jgi:hypothetical protein
MTPFQFNGFADGVGYRGRLEVAFQDRRDRF